VQFLTVSSDTSSASLGEVEDLSSNASAMVKISALSAWAELRIVSASQKFLVAVVQPHKVTLNKLWVGALKDYALMRVDSDGSPGSSNIGALDLIQSGLGKEVLLPVSRSRIIDESQLTNMWICSISRKLQCIYWKLWD
jgi:hypothetical protein